MKYFSLTLLLLLGQNILAQTADSLRVEELLNAFQTSLSLDEIQTEEVRSILYQTSSSMEEIRHLKSENQQAFRQQRQSVRMQFRSDMSDVLTEDQYQTFETALAQRRQNRKGGKRPGQAQRNQPIQNANSQNLGAETLSRSLDFLFNEVLTPTVRNKVNQNNQ